MVIHILKRNWHLFAIIILMILISIHQFHLPSNFFCIPRRTTREYLMGLNRSEIIPPFRMFERRFRRSEALKLNICVIEKNLSTILTAIACYFFNPERFRNASRNVNTEIFSRRFCAYKNEAMYFMAGIKNGLNKSNEWLHLSVSRDPIERFISGFVDKCLTEEIFKKRKGTCNNCQRNVTCFIEREYERMQRFVRGDRVNSFDDRHFFPQNWRCDFAHHFAEYKIIKYTSNGNGPYEFYAQLFEYIRGRNATESDVRFVEEQLRNGHTEHSTSDSNVRKELEAHIRNDPYIMNLLLRMYYYDFLIFGFKLPDILTINKNKTV